MQLSVGIFVGSYPRFREASFTLIDGGRVNRRWARLGARGQRLWLEWGEGAEWGLSVGEGQILSTTLQTKNLCLLNNFAEWHTYKLASPKALRQPNARLSLSIYPIFEDEKSFSNEQTIRRKVGSTNIPGRLPKNSRRWFP